MTPTSDVISFTSPEESEIQSLKNQVVLLQRRIDSFETRKYQDNVVAGVNAAAHSVKCVSEKIAPRVLYASDDPCVVNATAAKRTEIAEAAQSYNEIKASADDCCVRAFILSMSKECPDGIKCNDQHTILEWPDPSKEFTSHLLCGDFLRLIQGRWISDRFVCLQQKQNSCS